jgi:hypothetical protein
MQTPPDMLRYHALVAQYLHAEPPIETQIVEFWDPDSSGSGGLFRQTLPYSTVDEETMRTSEKVELVEPSEPLFDGGVPRFSTVNVQRELITWPVADPNPETVAFGTAINELDAAEKALTALFPGGEVPEKIAVHLLARTVSFADTYRTWAHTYGVGVEAPAPLVAARAGDTPHPVNARSCPATPADDAWDAQLGGPR